MIKRHVKVDQAFEVGTARGLLGPDSIISSRIFIWALLISLLGYLAYASTQGMSPYDEGLMCYGAEKVLHGAVPYRDFWTVYGPGQYYLLAAMFRVFGISLLVARIYTFTVEWVVVVLAYSISRKLTSPLGGLVSGIAITLWLCVVRSVLYPPIPALLFSLAAFLAIADSPPRLKRNALAGILVGFAILVRHDIGVYAFLGLSVTIVGREFFDSADGITPTSSRIARAIKWTLPHSIGMLAVVLPVIVALLRTVPRDLLYESFVYFPFRIYPQFRSLPFPLASDFSSSGAGISLHVLLHVSQDFLIFGVPLLILSAAAFFAFLNWQKGKLRLDRYWLAVGLTAFGFFMILSVRVRPDSVHFVVPTTVALILFPWILTSISTSPAMRPLSLSLRAFLIVCVSLLSLLCVARRVHSLWLVRDSARLQSIGIDRAKGISVVRDGDIDDLVTAIQYVQRRVPPGGVIYVGNMRHDKIFVSNGIFYFLSGRSSATRYAELHPGVATTAKVQSEIINDLKVHKVEYIVLWLAPTPEEPNRSAESSGVTILDDFIRANYKHVAEFGSYTILCRSDAAQIGAVSVNSQSPLRTSSALISRPFEREALN